MSVDRLRLDTVRRRRRARRLPVVLGLQLRHLLGSGGEGEVWAADGPDGVARALKLIRPDVLTDPPTFARRAHDLVRIDDPALVRVHRAALVRSGQWAGWGAMEMDLVDGRSLAQDTLGAATYVDTRPLAGALDRLHDGTWSDGVPLVHRDVKPANLIRGVDGDIVLVDPSGLRGVGGDMTFVGTPVFVAPEVLAGRVGPAADVYSFAATLVALHSGARGERLGALLATPDALDVPVAVARALSANPDDRPEHCADLVDDDRVRIDVDRAGSGDRTIVVGGSRSATASAASLASARETVDSTWRPQTARTWVRLALLLAATLPLIAGLVLAVPLVAVGGLAAMVAVLALDPSLRRDRTLWWLPLACARWLEASLDLRSDPAERARVEATIHGALVLPLVPVLGVVAGLRAQMIVLGTLGQLIGVGLTVAMAIVVAAVVTAGLEGSRLSLARVLLAPAWIVGVFAAAAVRVLAALAEALAPAAPAPDDDHGDDSDHDDSDHGDDSDHDGSNDRSPGRHASRRP